MPPEILALLNKPELIVAVLGVGALFGILAEQMTSALRRKLAAPQSPCRPERKPHRFDQGYWPARTPAPQRST